MHNVSLVLLVYNKLDVIEEVVRGFYVEVIKKLPKGFEFIVVEDGSTDGTKWVLDRLKDELPLTLVQSDERKGYMKAMKDGLKSSQNEIVFQSDADGEHNPKDFWKLYKYIDDCDMVVGYKMDRKPFYRLVVSRVNNYLMGLLFGVWLKDANCGFRLIRKEVVSDVVDDIGMLKYSANAEMVIRAKIKGYKIVQVPVEHIPTKSEVFTLKKMPKVIIKEFVSLFKLKKELR